jgi:hypothetical protein
MSPLVVAIVCRVSQDTMTLEVIYWSRGIDYRDLYCRGNSEVRHAGGEEGKR